MPPWSQLFQVSECFFRMCVLQPVNHFGFFPPPSVLPAACTAIYYGVDLFLNHFLQPVKLFCHIVDFFQVFYSLKDFCVTFSKSFVLVCKTIYQCNISQVSYKPVSHYKALYSWTAPDVYHSCCYFHFATVACNKTYSKKLDICGG